MPDLEYFVVAESAAVDQFTNRVSVFNIFENMIATKIPGNIPSLVALCAWDFDSKELGVDYGVTFIISDASGELINKNVNFKATQRRHRSFLSIQGLEVKAAGELIFEVRINSEYKAKHRATVEVVSDSLPAAPVH